MSQLEDPVKREQALLEIERLRQRFRNHLGLELREEALLEFLQRLDSIQNLFTDS